MKGLFLFIWSANLVTVLLGTNIDIRLRTSWDHVCPAAEALEFLKDVDDADAISYVDNFYSGKDVDNSLERVLESPSVRKFARLVIDNHYFSPRIEMLRSIERDHRKEYLNRDCPYFWFLFPDGEGLCDLQTLSKKVESMNAKTENFLQYPTTDFDLVFSRQKSGPMVIFYGNLDAVTPLSGSMSFQQYFEKSIAPQLKQKTTSFVEFIETAFEKNPMKMIFRHAGGGGENFDFLSGYGVKMMIKNTEYKASADEKEDTESSVIPFRETTQLDLIDLLKKVQEDADSLKKREQKMTASGDSDILKAVSGGSEGDSDSPDVDAVTTGLETDVLQKLLELNQDFPERADWLEKQIVNTLNRPKPPPKKEKKEDDQKKGDGTEKNDGEAAQAADDGEVDELDEQGFKGPAQQALPQLREMGISPYTAQLITLNNRHIPQTGLGIFPILGTLLPHFQAVERLMRTKVFSKEEDSMRLLKKPLSTKSPRRFEFQSWIESKRGFMEIAKSGAFPAIYYPSDLPPIYSVSTDTKTEKWPMGIQGVETMVQARQRSMMGGMMMFGGGSQIPEVRIPLAFLIYMFDPLSEKQLLNGLEFLRDELPSAIDAFWVMQPETGRIQKSWESLHGKISETDTVWPRRNITAGPEDIDETPMSRKEKILSYSAYLGTLRDVFSRCFSVLLRLVGKNGRNTVDVDPESRYLGMLSAVSDNAQKMRKRAQLFMKDLQTSEAWGNYVYRYTELEGEEITEEVQGGPQEIAQMMMLMQLGMQSQIPERKKRERFVRNPITKLPKLFSFSVEEKVEEGEEDPAVENDTKNAAKKAVKNDEKKGAKSWKDLTSMVKSADEDANDWLLAIQLLRQMFVKRMVNKKSTELQQEEAEEIFDDVILYEATKNYHGHMLGGDKIDNIDTNRPETRSIERSGFLDTVAFISLPPENRMSLPVPSINVNGHILLGENVEAGFQDVGGVQRQVSQSYASLFMMRDPLVKEDLTKRKMKFLLPGVDEALADKSRSPEKTIEAIDAAVVKATGLDPKELTAPKNKKASGSPGAVQAILDRQIPLELAMRKKSLEVVAKLSNLQGSSNLLKAHHEVLTQEVLALGGAKEEKDDKGQDSALEQGGKEGASSASEKQSRKIPWVFRQLTIPDEVPFFQRQEASVKELEDEPMDVEFDEETGEMYAAEEDREEKSTSDALSDNSFYHVLFLTNEKDLYAADVFTKSATSSPEAGSKASKFTFVFVGDQMWKKYGERFYCAVLKSSKKKSQRSSTIFSKVEESFSTMIKRDCSGKDEDLTKKLSVLEKAQADLSQQVLGDGKLETRVAAKYAKKDSTIKASEVMRWWCNGRVLEFINGVMEPIQEAHISTLEMLMPKLLDLKPQETENTQSPMAHIGTDNVERMKDEKKDSDGKDSDVKYANKERIDKKKKKDNKYAEVNSILNEFFDNIAGSRVDISRLEASYPKELTFRFGSSDLLEIRVICEPLSETMQQFLQLLSVLKKLFGDIVSVVLLFNPRDDLSKPPLTNYYREVIFLDQSGRGLPEPASNAVARAYNNMAKPLIIRKRNVLSLSLEVPPTWLVSAHNAEADFDNLIVKKGDTSVVGGTFILESMYMEGSATIAQDEDSFASFLGLQEDAAQGVELGMYAASGELKDDARVLRNHGYFQLAANPGMYSIKLMSDTAKEWKLMSAPFLTVDSYVTPPYQIQVKPLEGSPAYEKMYGDSAEDEGEFLVMTPRGLVKKGKGKGNRKKKAKELDVKGKNGDEAMDEDSSAVKVASKVAGKVTGWFSGLFGSDDPKEDVERGDGGDGKEVGVQQSQELSDFAFEKKAVTERSPLLDQIHIFTVASGHLYEKLMSIMILSVRKHTKSKLHFWFIDTFLSPKFKKFVPILAQKYDFEFSFISYKWPSWLIPQTEKQRLIWAYKILFLDVFFPLDVQKVIFIDADQVVRADVKELVELDLQDKVYGFVPMGDTNPDVEGFRFWKQGYWKNHLKEKPYHISALFVVDLVKYRERSGGDVLRQTYNTLAADPNSLANLDQDLPNFAQHSLEIFSLPKEWLWCETWCSSEELATAKTIDLCQNPLTKEPKLKMAQRIAPEWIQYHDQVVKLQTEFEQGIEGTAPGSDSDSTKASDSESDKKAGEKKTTKTSTTSTTTTTEEAKAIDDDGKAKKKKPKKSKKKKDEL